MRHKLGSLYIVVDAEAFPGKLAGFDSFACD
jgi:hypothetical protein